MRKANNVKFLLGLAAFVTTAAQAADSTSMRGQMSSGGRRAANAIQVQFASPGTGIDEAGRQALEKFIAYETQHDRVEEVKQSPWGREGEINYCIEFKDFKAAYKAAHTIGRIVWAGVTQGEANSYRMTAECNEQSVRPFQGTNLTPLVQEADRKKSTLECKFYDAQSQYSARLLVREVLEEDNTVRADLSLLQSAPNARYRPIHSMTSDIETVIGARTFTVNYYSPALNLEIWPEYLDGSVDYHGRLQNGETTLIMQCLNK